MKFTTIAATATALCSVAVSADWECTVACDRNMAAKDADTIIKGLKGDKCCSDPGQNCKQLDGGRGDVCGDGNKCSAKGAGDCDEVKKVMKKILKACPVDGGKTGGVCAGSTWSIRLGHEHK